MPVENRPAETNKDVPAANMPSADYVASNDASNFEGEVPAKKAPDATAKK